MYENELLLLRSSLLVGVRNFPQAQSGTKLLVDMHVQGTLHQARCFEDINPDSKGEVPPPNNAPS